MRTGGVLRLWDVVYDFNPAEVVQRLEAWFATAGETVETEWTRAELEEHVRDEHSTFAWLLEAITERAGFDLLDVDCSADGLFAKYVLRAVGRQSCGSRQSWSQRLRLSAGRAARKGVVARMLAPTAPFA